MILGTAPSLRSSVNCSSSPLQNSAAVVSPVSTFCDSSWMYTSDLEGQKVHAVYPKLPLPVASLRSASSLATRSSMLEGKSDVVKGSGALNAEGTAAIHWAARFLSATR